MGREEHTAPVQKLAPSVFIRVHSLLAHVISQLNFGRVASSTLARPVSQLTRMKWFV